MQGDLGAATASPEVGVKCITPGSIPPAQPRPLLSALDPLAIPLGAVILPSVWAPPVFMLGIQAEGPIRSLWHFAGSP